MPRPRTRFTIPRPVTQYMFHNGRFIRRRVAIRRPRRTRFQRLFGGIAREIIPANDTAMEPPQPPQIPLPPNVVSRSSTTRSYRDKRRASEEAWASRRQSAVDSFINSQALIENTMCTVQDCLEPAHYRCLDCGPMTFLCDSHVKTTHQCKLHVPELWKDGCFSPTFIQQDTWALDHHGSCNGVQERSIIVIDYKGRQHTIGIQFCKCQGDLETLIQHRLWPATASRPVAAFSFELMYWMRMVFLECHVPLQSICHCISWMSPQQLQCKVKNPYKMLAEDAFSEFRYFCEQLEALDIRQDNSSPICPACPKDDGKLFVSLDAIFGLKRWKKSGQSETPPRHGTTFFLNQTTVDKFLEEYQCSSRDVASSCSNFQAGDSLRSKTTTKKVDETGVFGAVCRHEMPIKFFSLKQGERLGNAVFLLRHMLQKKPPNTQMYVLYDIACKLQAHLKAADKRTGVEKLLPQVQLAIPAFHVYGHKPDCQMKLSPRRIEGFCLSDGEQVERLWSFLRKFASITKEMTPSNRIDALSDALMHYGRRMGRNLAQLLVHRYERASKLHAASSKELEQITARGNEGEAPITVEDIKQWMDNTCAIDPNTVTGTDLSDREVYTLKLKAYYELRKNYEEECANESPVAGSIPLLLKKLKRIDAELLICEQGSGRWTCDSMQFQSSMRSIEDRKRKALLSKLHNMTVDRWFLLLLKKKYADGQAIAKLLCRQINTCSNKLKKQTTAYNEEMNTFVTRASSPFPDSIQFEDVCNLTSDLWKCLETTPAPGTNTNPVVPLHIMQQFADVVHKVNRSLEEMEQLKAEMNSVFTFYSEQEQNVRLKLSSNVGIGRKCLMKQKYKNIVHQLKHCYTLFHPMCNNLSAADIPDIFDEHYNDSIDSNTDDDMTQELLDMLAGDSSDDED